MTKLKSNPFRVGALVTSAFHPEFSHIVRRVTMCFPDVVCGSGWRASADSGGVCSSCGKPLAPSIEGVDSAWFDLVSK